MLQVQYRSHDAYTFKAVTLDQNENTTMSLCKKIKNLEALKETDFLYILNAEDSRRKFFLCLIVGYQNSIIFQLLIGKAH